MPPTQLDIRQSVLRAALGMVGSAVNDTVDTIFPKIDAELAKLFEDRNVLLTDGGFITFTGTQIQFTENLNLVINQKISGASPQVISLGSSTQTLANGDMWYATVNRTAGTAATAVAATLPAATSVNQEIFLLAKRVDAGDGTQRIYWRTGMAMNAGQTLRLGSSGSGSGSGGTGDDLDALLFRASFRDDFSDGPTSALSAVDATANMTDTAAYSAAKALYQLSYDASKTIAAATTTTNINISAVASFTVKIGDIVIYGTQARRITAVATQASFTTEAFTTAPTLAGQVTVSQVVYTKDVYNLTVDGAALSEAFGAATFSEIAVDYEDTTTVGDNIFNPNIAPVIAYSASQNGTAFSDIAIRPTNETDQVGAYFLPAAGTALYMRFFAYKQSGSGSVNILGYRSFLQKTPAATAGGIINASYAFTNGVGTPVNCTLSVVGGKTVATLTYQYAVGVSAGLPIGSIEVYLNGQMIPRFINATLTPDASYTEFSNNSIQLDKDYSAQNLSLEVIQRFQIVDASSQNTTNIANHAEALGSGFQGFINQSNVLNATSVAGSPVAGTFYSTISGRASMVDLSQDLQARMGINRIMTQNIYEIQNEFGPNGERVFEVTNDNLGQIRFVGNITSATIIKGNQVVLNSQNDYIEITFYGTGLNVLFNLCDATRDIRYSVDGGSESANLVGVSGSAVIDDRNYSSNQIIPVVSTLSLGIHTVKIRNAAAAVNAQFNGFEILNESSSVKVNPGIAYVAGAKLALAAQSVFSYSAPVTGIRGGRVLVYQASDGSIGKSFQAVDAAQANLGSASHTNEEIIRTYHWREFAAGRADDFSTDGANVNRAFTLDDGTTTLVCSGGYLGLNGGSDQALYLGTTNSYCTFTFVGTGCDILKVDSSASGSLDSHTVFVDGVSIGTIGGGTPSLTKQRIKLVSGLPYGTHTIKVIRPVASSQDIGVIQFIAYGPKKPTLPSGAVELADYNVMADFLLVSTAVQGPSESQGLLFKGPSREIVYTGIWVGSFAVTNGVGFEADTSTAGATSEYTFFGTGIELVGLTSTGTANVVVQFNGSNYTGAATLTGAGSWTPGTSTWAVPGASKLSITGLALGKYTIKLTYNGTFTFARTLSYNIITPIHSAKSNLYGDLQNTLPVGSCGISDNRKTTPTKDISVGPKAWAKAVGITSGGITTSSASYVPIPDMSTTIKLNKAGELKISWHMELDLGANADARVAAFVDGVFVGSESYLTAPTYGFAVSGSVIVPVAAGTHKVDLYWKVTASAVLNNSNNTRNLFVEER